MKQQVVINVVGTAILAATVLGIIILFATGNGTYIGRF